MRNFTMDKHNPSIICMCVKRDSYIPGTMIKPCDHCEESLWVYVGILIRASEKNPDILCAPCYLKARGTHIEPSYYVRKIRRIMDRICEKSKQ